MKIFGLFILAMACLISYLIANRNDDIVSIASITFLPCALALYFYPRIRAVGGNPRLPTISILNLLAGWTVIGWIGAFLWTLTPPGANAGIKECPFLRRNH